jgi:2'-hydroxyisoflavone reductase
VEFLNQNHVSPWSDLPAWLPDSGESAGFAHVDISKAINADLTFIPLEDTIRETLKWASSRPVEHEWLAGLKPAREKELLELLGK